MTSEAGQEAISQEHRVINKFDQVPDDKVAHQLLALSSWMDKEDDILAASNPHSFHSQSTGEAVTKLLPKAAKRIPDEHIGEFANMIISKFYKTVLGDSLIPKEALIALLEVSDRLPETSISDVTFILGSLMYCHRFYDPDNNAKQTLIKIAANIKDSSSLNIFLTQIRNFASLSQGSFHLNDNMLESLEAMAGSLTDELKEEMIDVMLAWNVRSEDWIPSNFQKSGEAHNKDVISFLLEAIGKMTQHIPDSKIETVTNMVESIAKEYGWSGSHIWKATLNVIAKQVSSADLEELPKKIETGLGSEDITEQIIALIYLEHNVNRIQKPDLDILIPKVRGFNGSKEYYIKDFLQKIFESYYKTYPEEIFNLVATFSDDKEGSAHKMDELVKYAHFMNEVQVTRMFELFQEFADSDDPEVRFHLTWKLGSFREKHFLEQVFVILKQLSDDSDSGTREEVATSLGSVILHIDDERSKPVFETLLKLMRDADNAATEESHDYSDAQKVGKQAAATILDSLYHLSIENLGMVCTMITSMEPHPWYKMRQYQADILRVVVRSCYEKQDEEKVVELAEQALPKLTELLADQHQNVVFEAQTALKRISGLFPEDNVGKEAQIVLALDRAESKVIDLVLDEALDDPGVQGLGEVGALVEGE